MKLLYTKAVRLGFDYNSGVIVDMINVSKPEPLGFHLLFEFDAKYLNSRFSWRQ